MAKATKHVAKDGGTSWSTVIEMARAPDGRRRQKRLTARTKDALKALVSAELAKAGGPVVDDQLLTVAESLPIWLEAKADAGAVKGRTLHIYGGTIRRWLIPELGTVRLAKLGALDIQRAWGRLRARGLAPSSVVHAHGVLRGALAQAVKWRLIPANPCDGVSAGKRVPAAPTVWNAEQAAAFLARVDAESEPLAVLYRLALSTAMRLGELQALRWANVDLAAGRLAVVGTATIGRDGRASVDTPKTASSRRAIALAPQTVAALRSHRAKQAARRLALGPAWRDADLVIDRGDGGPFSLTGARERLDRHAAAAGLPRLNFHGLRHTAATLLMAAGVHAKVVAELMGHSDTAQTMRYSHTSVAMHHDAAALLGRLLAAPPAPSDRAESGGDPPPPTPISGAG